MPAPEQAATEDDGYVGLDVFVSQGSRPRVDDVAGVLEERNELRLPSCEDENPLTPRPHSVWNVSREGRVESMERWVPPGV